MSNTKRIRRHALRHERTPSSDPWDVGMRMGSAGLWFVFLLPIAILFSLVFVWLFG